MHGVRVLHPHQPINPLAFYPSIMAHRRDTDRSCELPLSLEADFEQIERVRAHGRHHRRQATVQYLAHDDVDPIDRSIDPLTRPTGCEIDRVRGIGEARGDRRRHNDDDAATLLFSSSPSIIHNLDIDHIDQPQLLISIISSPTFDIDHIDQPQLLISIISSSTFDIDHIINL